MANAAELSFRTAGACKLAIVSPNDPAAMSQYAEECRVLGIPFIYDFGQQVARISGDELLDGLTGAAVVISNDYEFQVLCEKTGLDEAGVLAKAKTLVVTLGEHGCKVVRPEGTITVPAVPPTRIVDPTGVGDAFRGGLMKGLAAGADWATCARLGSVAAAYALEHLGGTSHAYTLDEFRARYEQHFGAARPAGAGGRVTSAGVRRATVACLVASLVWLAAILAAPHALHAAPGAPGRARRRHDLSRRPRRLPPAAGAQLRRRRASAAGVRPLHRHLCRGAAGLPAGGGPARRAGAAAVGVGGHAARRPRRGAADGGQRRRRVDHRVDRSRAARGHRGDARVRRRRPRLCVARVAAGAIRRGAAAASPDRVKRLPAKYARLRKLHAP